MTTKASLKKYMQISGVGGSFLDSLPEDNSVTMGSEEAWVCLATAAELENNVEKLIKNLGHNTGDIQTIHLIK
jgi:hypothetical protein